MDERIASPSKTIEILQKSGFRFSKKFGQNFLIDLHVLDKIIRAASIEPDDVCVEIGPGIGSLTQALAEAAKDVFAVEIDERLIPLLQDNLKEYANVHIVHNDFLKLDLERLLEDHHIRQPIRVVANLPYYVTTPILMSLLEGPVPVKNITIMVQEEVARRMQAGPGTKDYGALSLAVQYYAEAEIMAYVPQNCFIPRPNVRSAVIRLTVYPEKPVRAENEKLLFQIIRAAFGERRKQLANSLTDAGVTSLEKAVIQRVLTEQGLSAQVRGEELTLSQFAALTDALEKAGANEQETGGER